MGAPGMQYANDNVMLGRSAWWVLSLHCNVRFACMILDTYRAGSQKFGGAVWSGDTHSDFRDLGQQFRAGLNMVMSGIPYWTTDIGNKFCCMCDMRCCSLLVLMISLVTGGYGGGNIDSSNFRQLIVRWFQ
jgi:alpha-D-xyloside xylohydrolase